ncbi:hypothetical protein [Prochlorothrix hollandica]|uniref:hypothetical protein n=1 Tax=Prochlorothrix hollandica TaxID=1223 RepID=UPI00034CFD98|nr:hypothetical protein [Prochlorothrix hollandica]
MSRPQQTITLSITPAEREALEALALELGYRWGDRGNTSAMIKAIANGALTVGDAQARPLPARSPDQDRAGKIAAKIRAIADELESL